MVIKGAPEVISRIIGVNEYLAEVATQQERGRRAISAAVINSTDFNKIKEELEAGKSLTNCTYIGTWFIEDPASLIRQLSQPPAPSDPRIQIPMSFLSPMQEPQP